MGCDRMGSLSLWLLLSLLSLSTLSTAFGPPGRECRSNRDCPGFRRTSCEGRGPNFLFIIPTCGRRRTHFISGRCDSIPDTFSHVGNLLGGNNRCRAGSRCADCLASHDCRSYETCSGGRCIDNQSRNNINHRTNSFGSSHGSSPSFSFGSSSSSGSSSGSSNHEFIHLRG